MFETILLKSFIVMLIVAGIPLLVGTFAGLFVAVLQAATQIQDQGITYLVRFAAVSTTIAIAYPWFRDQIIQFMQEMLLALAFLGSKS